MGCLLERKARIIFVSASSINESGKRRKIVIESRPEFAIVRLNGSRKGFPIAWEMIYEIAKRNDAKNLHTETRAEQKYNRSKAKVGG